jgi:hypothetical protein
METIESVAELRYSLDTTLVDPEQHAMAQAAAAAQLAAGAAWRQHGAPAVDPRALQQQQSVPAVQAQQPLRAVEAGYQPDTGSNGCVASAAAAAIATQDAAGAILAMPSTALAGAGADGQQHIVASAAGPTHLVQQQLLQESQERQRAQQLAAQLQQQVQELQQQQLDASRDFQHQLQQARDAAAAELHIARQVSFCQSQATHALLCTPAAAGRPVAATWVFWCSMWQTTPRHQCAKS